jgi:hypothetical protein
MAKRMKSKIQPAVMKLTFLIDKPKGGGNIPSGQFQTRFIDLSQVASIVNRRFYRQGLNWAVANFKFTSPKDCQVLVQKLPNTWVMSNAWEKGFRAWRRQQNDALNDGQQESVRAKYNDFKIFADKYHLIDGFSQNLMPRTFVFDSDTQTSTSQYATPGEWEASQIVIPNFVTVGTNYEPFIQAVGEDVGGTGGSISLIKAYEDSRSVPQSPDPLVPTGVISADNIYRAMFDVGDNMEDVMANVVGKNDELPYPQLNYPGGDTQMSGLELHDSNSITSTTIGGMTNIMGGNFPCGLIAVTVNNTSDTAIGVALELTLVPGTHRGYLCEPMTDM